MANDHWPFSLVEMDSPTVKSNIFHYIAFLLHSNYEVCLTSKTTKRGFLEIKRYSDSHGNTVRKEFNFSCMNVTMNPYKHFLNA